MTSVRYSIRDNGKEVVVVNTMNEAKQLCADSNGRYTYKVIYKEFNPDDTPKKLDAMKKHAIKVMEKLRSRSK